MKLRQSFFVACSLLFFASIYAQVSLTIHAGSSLAIADSMNIALSGNWNNNGTFTAGKSTVTFADTFSQSIAGAVATTFNSMTVNKPSREVTLNVNGTTLNDKLTMSAGNVLLGANNFTFGTTSAAVTGAAVGKSLVTNGTGAVNRQIAASGSFQFPIAPTTTRYNPVTLTLGGSDPTETWSVSVKNSFDVAPNDPNTCLTRQWTITEAAPGGNSVVVGFQFTGSDERGPLFSPANPTMFIGRRPTGGPWQSTLATKTGSDPYTVSATFTAFSPFAVTTDASALPIQLASFTARRLQNQTIRLDWRTISEVNNYGFCVHRANASDSVWSELPNSFIAGHGTTNEPHDYTFTDNTVTSGSWMYKLKQVDLDGTIHFTEPIIVAGATAVGDQLESAPMEFVLFQNYPNPFNPSTTIKFSVEKTEGATLNVYNILGQRVATLFDDVAEAGQYYKVRFDGNNLASGMYVYRLQSGKRSDLKKLLLLK